MPDTSATDRGYTDAQAAKIAKAYARLTDAGESVTVHKLRDTAKVALSATQAWLAANAPADGVDVPDVPTDELAGILAPLWTRAYALATDTVAQAAAETEAGLKRKVAAEVERAEAAEAKVAALDTELERLTDELAEAREALTAADSLRADLAAAVARAEAAEDRAQRAEDRADQQMAMIGDLIRKTGKADSD